MANHIRLAARSLTDLHYATAWNETHVKPVAALLRGHGAAVLYAPGLYGSVEAASSDNCQESQGHFRSNHTDFGGGPHNVSYKAG